MSSKKPVSFLRHKMVAKEKVRIENVKSLFICSNVNLLQVLEIRIKLIYILIVSVLTGKKPKRSSAFLCLLLGILTHTDYLSIICQSISQSVTLFTCTCLVEHLCSVLCFDFVNILPN